LDPELLKKGKDDYYASSGLEYIAYTNLKTNTDEIRRNQGIYDEAKRELKSLETDLGNK